MEVLSPIVTGVLLVALAAVWMYAVLHPLFNHRQVGVVILMLAMFMVAMRASVITLIPILYALLHDCPDRKRQHA